MKLAPDARSAVARLLLPGFLLCLGLWAITAPSLDLAASLGVSPRLADGLLLLGTVVFFYPLIVLAERLLPERPQWNRDHGDRRTDVMHLILSGSLAQMIFQATLGAVALSAGLWLAQRLGGTLWPTTAPVAVQWFLAVLVAEFGHYAFHRLSHEHPLVWRLHAIHHSPQRLYWLNATRFHWLDIWALIALQSMPLLLLGAGREALLSYTIFAAVFGQLQHMNVRQRPSALDWVFSTPVLHRWHHSTDPREGNQNYGAIFVFWDLLFGTFFRPTDRAFDIEVGIGGRPDFPRGYWAQQADPFRRQVVR